MKVILPLRAELGLKVWWFVPAVHALEGERVVYIEPGEQALFPSANTWLEVERQEDSLRRNRYARDAEFVAWAVKDARERFGPEVEILKPDAGWKRKRFVPKPMVRHGVSCDVMVCPRKRAYGSSKNWPEWEALVQRLCASGLRVFAGGAPDSSYAVDCERAWDYERFLDATIEAMLSARLVVATDAGLANLAVLCGKPLLMITHGEGIVAPGPSSDENGKVMDKEYWPVHIDRYKEANWLNSSIALLYDAWFDLDLVVSETLRRMG